MLLRFSRKSNLPCRYTPNCFWNCNCLTELLLLKFSEGCDLFYFTRKNKLLQGVPSQNERSLPVERNAITKRLNVQDGFKRRIFRNIISKKTLSNTWDCGGKEIYTNFGTYVLALLQLQEYL